MAASRLRHVLQELAELGPAGFAFRLGWEARQRSGISAALERPPPPLDPAAVPSVAALRAALPFDAPGVREAMRDRLGPAERARLEALARWGAEGRILAFGRTLLDYGSPPDWYQNPVLGRRWPSDPHWSRALADERRVGDVKLTWELARFPHAYAIARAAAHDPGRADPLAGALASQITSFVEAAPFGRGIHWNSGQEIVIRLLAWLTALGALGDAPAMAAIAPAIAGALHDGAVHVERHIGYTLNAVYNNHLVTEALGLLAAGMLLPGARQAGRWRAAGARILTEEASRQVYEDGASLQLSHNYERVVLQVYLWAVALARHAGEPVPAEWTGALDRAATFLHAQQNPGDGRLPNYGSNDGALPSPFTSCDFSDFRPTLQAARLAARGERLYPPGPWDEEAAWLLGAAALDAPLAPPPRTSVAFPSGFQVTRGSEPATFSVLRCGTIQDRFSQIDMLHLDVWWRGENVLVDAGSYLYNGPPAWHRHFSDTECHNTVAVDGRDQMLPFRRFKNLYWTRADLLRFEDAATHAVVEGEHHGYARHPGGCVHRRAVLFVKDGLWVVVDRIAGEGAHTARVQWLGGPFPARFEPDSATMALETPAGAFSVSVRDLDGRPVHADVVAGRGNPPRGWLSRYYAEKLPAPSLAAERAGACPLGIVSLLSGGPAEVHVTNGEWSVDVAGLRARFRLADGRFETIRVDRT